MARRALNTAELNELNLRGPQGIGDRFLSIEQAGYLRFKTWVAPAAASTTNGGTFTLTAGAQAGYATGITNPDMPRVPQLTVQLGGGSQLAANAVIYGTDWDDNVISETIVVSAVADATTVVATKAYKTITSIDLPARAQSGDSIELGYTDKLGFDVPLVGNTVILAMADGVYETTRPTVTTSATAVSGNFLDPNTACNAARDFVALFVDMRSSDVSI